MAYVGPDLDSTEAPGTPATEEGEAVEEAAKDEPETPEKETPEKEAVEDEEEKKDEPAAKADPKKDEKKKPEDEETKVSRAHANLARREKKILETKATAEREIATARAAVDAERTKLQGIVRELEPRLRELERFEAAKKDHESFLAYLEKDGMSPDLIVSRTKERLTPEQRRIAALEEERETEKKTAEETKKAEAKREREAKVEAANAAFVEVGTKETDYPFLNALYTGPQILQLGVDVATQLSREGVRAADWQILKYLDGEAKKRAVTKLKALLENEEDDTQSNGGTDRTAKKVGTKPKALSQSLTTRRTTIPRDDKSEAEIEAELEADLQRAVREDAAAAAG